MGMDVVAIMKHEMDAEALLGMPERINAWHDLNSYYLQHHPDGRKEINAQWDCGPNPMTKERLNIAWDAWHGGSPVWGVNSIECNFGYFRIHRQTISFTPWPQHKYANLYYEDSRPYVLNFIRKIANLIGADKILYCTDSACSTALILEKVNLGFSFDEIMQYGLNFFGDVPKSLPEAVYNYFFIDDFTLDLEAPNTDKVMLDRCTEEYALEERFGGRFYIYRTIPTIN
ncbi:MAG: hypothetical protein IT258_11000 [Saprospiraceae bacterium]|nr:hypothetical protein [Saprospiraceae bacterium]